VTAILFQRFLVCGLRGIAPFLTFFYLASVAIAQQNGPRSVLVLYGEKAELPAIVAVKSGLDAALTSDKNVEVYSEFLDFARFPAQTAIQEFASHLRSRYFGRKFDLVVTVAGSALNFALDHRESLFAGAPIVFCSVDRREVDGGHLPPGVIGFPITFDFRRTLDLAFRLQPNTKEVVCIAGTASFDQLWAEECRKVLDGYGGKFTYRFIGTGPIDETLLLVRKLPADTIVLYISTLRDGQGRSFLPVEVAGRVVQQSNVPVYGLASNQLEQGIVGGSLFDFGAHGVETGDLCRKVLADEMLESGSLQPAKPNRLLLNWLALNKWHLAQSRIPKETIVRFREPSLWEEHPKLVVGVIVTAILGTTLVVVLLRSVTRLRRTKRELDDRLRFEQLVAALSARFVSARFEKVDDEINGTLSDVSKAMGLDRCALLELCCEEGDVRISHQPPGNGVDVTPSPVPNLQLPWFFRQISKGRTIALRDVAKDLPAEAIQEKDFCREFGINAALVLPLFQRGTAARAVVYAKVDRYQMWPESVISELESIGQIFGSALERKQAEELLRESAATLSLATLSADLGLWSRDLRTNQIWATHRTRNMYDFPADAAFTFSRFLESLHPDDRPSTEKAIEQAVAEGQDYNLEYRVIRGNGAIRWIAARGRVIYNAAGQPMKMMGASFDITERKQRELDTARHRLEMAHLGRVALMGELTASLAHELNQPLTAIVSNAAAGERFLDRGVVDLRELHELLHDIVTDGERAGKIIRGIREMIKKGEVTRGQVDMNQVVNDVVRLTKSDALSRSCTVVAELGPRHVWVEADPVQLQQVLLNLVLNSFDAMRDTPVELRRVVLSTRSDVNGIVQTGVRDFGTGLSENARKRIFEHFFSTKEEGLGMGLAIARSIVESFGGMLDARNAPGRGAVFYFVLPACHNAGAA